MKRLVLVIAMVAVTAVGTSLYAMPSGSSALAGSALTGSSGQPQESAYLGGPKRLSIGVYWAQDKRDIESNGFVSNWKFRHTLGFLGVDVFPWLTIQGAAGESLLTTSPGENGDGDFEWAVGAQARLLDYRVVDTGWLDDAYWCSIQADGQYSGSSADAPVGSLEWNELFASLTVALTSRPERYGFLNAIGLYAGPAYSSIDGNNETFRSDFNEDQTYGVIGGLMVCPSDNLSIKLELQKFDHTSVGVCGTFHF